MLSVKVLRENLMPLSPQAAIEHWLRVFEKHSDNPEFENPRVNLCMRSGTQYMGYLVSGESTPNSRDKFIILSLIIKNDTDQARDIVYLNLSDIESVTFFDIDPVLNFLARK